MPKHGYRDLEKLRQKQRRYDATPHRRERARARQLERRYGISQSEYDRILAVQGGVCKVCGTSEPGGYGGTHFQVDHDHTTGVVRGLLCWQCNSALGMTHESPQVLRDLADYISGFAT